MRKRRGGRGGGVELCSGPLPSSAKLSRLLSLLLPLVAMEPPPSIFELGHMQTERGRDRSRGRRDAEDIFSPPISSFSLAILFSFL